MSRWAFFYFKVIQFFKNRISSFFFESTAYRLIVLFVLAVFVAVTMSGPDAVAEALLQSPASPVQQQPAAPPQPAPAQPPQPEPVQPPPPESAPVQQQPEPTQPAPAQPEAVQPETAPVQPADPAGAPAAEGNVPAAAPAAPDQAAGEAPLPEPRQPAPALDRSDRSERGEAETGSFILDQAELIDTVVVSTAYVWLCCGIVIMLLIPLVFLFLQIRGRSKIAKGESL